MFILATQRTSQLLCGQPAVQITGWGWKVDAGHQEPCSQPVPRPQTQA